MTFLKSKRLHRCGALLVALTLLASLATLLCIPAGATFSCGHGGEHAENGFCSEEGCNGYEIPALNAGDPNDPDDDVYEIASAGALYYFKNVILEDKEQGEVVRAKLTAHITVIEDFLNEQGEVNPQHQQFYDGGPIKEDLPQWLFTETVTGVELDGNGYTVSGLWGQSTDGTPVGLFGRAENVTVKNLGILDSLFSSENYAGALIGEALGGCTVENCFVLESKVTGAMSAGLVGKLGGTGAASTLRNSYTDAASAVFECAGESTVTKCYYLADAEADSIAGTIAMSAAQMTDGTLLAELRVTGADWQESCARHVPMLRKEHYYPYACRVDCEGKSCGDNDCNDEDCGHVDCVHTREMGEEGLVPHTFQSKCDASCDVCGNIRQLENYNHYYRGSCDPSCDECGYIRAATGEHKYSNNCDEYCDNCLFHRETVQGHVYSGDCDRYCDQCKGERADAAAHAYEKMGCDMLICAACGTMSPSGENHSYDHACDTECNDCGAKREITHAFGDYVAVSEATHFTEGVKERTCSVCGYKDTLAIEKLPGWPVWLILTVSVSGVALLAGGGFALYHFVFKKRKK